MSRQGQPQKVTVQISEEEGEGQLCHLEYAMGTGLWEGWAPRGPFTLRSMGAGGGQGKEP